MLKAPGFVPLSKNVSDFQAGTMRETETDFCFFCICRVSDEVFQMGFPTTEFDLSFFALPLSCKYAISLAPLFSILSFLSGQSVPAKKHFLVIQHFSNLVICQRCKQFSLDRQISEIMYRGALSHGFKTVIEMCLPRYYAG